MNGPEHYAEAERLVEAARRDFREADEGPARILAESRAHVALAAAQVHATLALAAAQAGATLGLHGVPSGAWSEVTR